MDLLFAEAGMSDWTALFEQYGPICGPLLFGMIFFIWRDWNREASLTKRIVALEDDRQKVLIPLIKEISAVVAKNTTVMERLEKHLDK